MAVDLLKNKDDLNSLQLSTLKKLLEDFDPDKHLLTTPYSKFPIHYFTAGDTPGKIRAAQMVLERSKNPNITIQYAPDYTAPVIFALFNEPETLQHYIARGVNLYARDSKNDSIFHYFNQGTPLKSVRLITKELGASTAGLLHADTHGYTPLDRWLEKQRIRVNIGFNDQVTLEFPTDRLNLEELLADHPKRRESDKPSTERKPPLRVLIPREEVVEHARYFKQLLDLVYEQDAKHLDYLGGKIMGHAEGFLLSQLKNYVENHQSQNLGPNR